MTRRAIYIICLWLLAVALLAGCGSAGTTATTDTTSAGATTTKTGDGAQPAETVTVAFSYAPYGYDAAKEEAFWKAKIAEFESANPGIRIEMTWESWEKV